MLPGPDWPELLDAQVTGPVILRAREPLMVSGRRGHLRLRAASPEHPDAVYAVRLAAGQRAVIHGARRGREAL